MQDATRLFVAILAFRSTEPGSETVSLRKRYIRAPDLDAARERALVLGTAPLDADGAGPSWIFAGVQAITEIELWHGEGLDALESHVKTELAANPFRNLPGSS